ncbi:MAG TPA: hypothetical protein VFW28_05535 [Micropepsaceae bacterium]|nr:hypothetical protein [Micropepsaceae bacterium]
MGDGFDPKVRYERAAAWLPVVVSMLLVMIVAVFILAAPSQIITPKDSGYLIASIPPQLEQTAMR